MKIETLLFKLKEAKQVSEGDGDPELGHAMADAAILEYIGNLKIQEAYDAIVKWYA